MKKLMSLKDFEKESSNEVLSPNFISTISGGSSCIGDNCQDTWESETLTSSDNGPNSDTCYVTWDENGKMVKHKHEAMQ